MIKTAEKEVRNIRFHVKIKDADLLGESIKKVAAERTSGNINEDGRGFKVPDMSDNSATIYSSFNILADQKTAPKGEYIYTMEKVTFETEIKVGKEDYKQEMVNLQLNGGWVLKDGEYVLVVFAPKNGDERIVDIQKMQGRLFYNAVFVNYVTNTLGKDILESRGFSERIPEGEYPNVNRTYDLTKKVTDLLRGKTSTPSGGRGGLDAQQGMGSKPATMKAPDFVKNNYFLYDPSGAEIVFGHRQTQAPTPAGTPARQTPPFNRQTDPSIAFGFNFPNYATGERSRPGDDGTPAYNILGETSNPGDVEVSFANIPRTMPYEIYEGIYDYLKNGLEGVEKSATPTKTHGRAIFTENPPEGDQSLRDKNRQKIKTLHDEIEKMISDNSEYRVDFDENRPSEYQSQGKKKNPLKYINELEAFIARLKKNLPKSLKEINDLIDDKGYSFVNPRNINLLNILKTKQ